MKYPPLSLNMAQIINKFDSFPWIWVSTLWRKHAVRSKNGNEPGVVVVFGGGGGINREWRLSAVSLTIV